MTDALQALSFRPMPRDWLLRSKVADLLHLLEFSSISAATGGDDEQARKVMADLKGMLADATPPAQPEPDATAKTASGEPVNDPRCVAHVSVYEDGGITALYMPEHGAQMLALLQEDARLHNPAALCACKDRPATACPGEWEPGCDLGANPAHVRVVG